MSALHPRGAALVWHDDDVLTGRVAPTLAELLAEEYVTRDLAARHDDSQPETGAPRV